MKYRIVSPYPEFYLGFAVAAEAATIVAEAMTTHTGNEWVVASTEIREDDILPTLDDWASQGQS